MITITENMKAIIIAFIVLMKKAPKPIKEESLNSVIIS